MKLRYIEARDSERIVTWRNANTEFFPPQQKWTVQTQMRWHAKYLLDIDDFMYMVCLDDGTPVGTLGATKVERGVYRIGRVLLGRRDIAPPGIMSEALQEVMRLHEGAYYYLKVLTANERAIRFYLKNGFVKYAADNTFIWMDRIHDPVV